MLLYYKGGKSYMNNFKFLINKQKEKKQINILSKKLTFLTEKQIFGENKLDIIEHYGPKCAITDFAILLGGFVSSEYYTSEGNSLKDRTGWWWTKTPYDDNTRVVSLCGDRDWNIVNKRCGGARPALPYSSIQFQSRITSVLSAIGMRDDDLIEIMEIEYGEYPQTIVDKKYSHELEKAYNNGNLRTTGKNYTTDSVRYQDTDTRFRARTHTEYEYNGSKYIRFIGDSNCHGEVLSDGRLIKSENVYWVRVEPITWLVDERANIALSKKILFSGVQFINRIYEGNFDETDIKKFMVEYFSKEIVSDRVYQKDNIKQNKEKFDEEMQNLLDKIDYITSELPESSKNFFIEKKEYLIKKYFDDLNKEQPKFNLNDQNNLVNLELNSTSIGSARTNFIIGLNNIINSLSNGQKQLELLQQIKNYNEIINKNYDSIIEKPINIEDYLSNISFIASKIDQQSGDNLIKKVSNLINTLKEKYEHILKKDINNEYDIILKIEDDPIKELKINIINIYDEYYSYYLKVNKYISLKNSLNNKNNIKEYSDEGDISSTLNNITYLLSLINEEGSNLIKDRFELLKTNYITIIDDLISKKEIDKYDDLEKKLRKELIPIIEEIRKSNSTYVNIKKLLKEINEQLTRSDNVKLSVVKSFVENINNLCTENNLSSDIINSINNQISDILKKGQEKLKLTKLNSEVDKVEKEIYGSLADIELKLQMYIKNINNYNEIYHKNSK